MQAQRFDLARPPGLPLADAYLPWALASGFRDAGPSDAGGGWHWLLLELYLPARDFAALARATARQHLRVPAHYLRPPRGLADSVYCTAACSRRFLEALAGRVPADRWGALLGAICRFEIGFMTPCPPDPDARPQAIAAHGLGPADVVVGIVDDGIAFANERFRVQARDGSRASRLLAFWDQSRGGVARGPWVHGPVHDRRHLHAALHAAGAHGPFDEQEAYRRLDYREARHRVTHGTHVMDLAAGANPGEPLAAPIVAVQLPAEAITDTSCASTTVYMLDAIRFVMSAADAVAPPGRICPAVVNLSIGNIAGPHDGSSIFEQALDEMSALRDDCHVVMAAGNSYLSRCHAWMDLGPGAEANLDWQIQPGDGTPSYLELWAGRADGADPAAADAAAVVLELTPPGEPSVSVRLGEAVLLRIDGEPVAMLSWQFQVANGRRPMALIAVAPTAGDTGWLRPAPCGAWRVALHNGGAQHLECRAYVQRDDAPLGRPMQGRQSWLEDPDYHRFDRRGGVQLRDSRGAYVRRSGTLNGLASGVQVHVAGGALHDRDGRLPPARYSSVPLPDEREGGAGLRALVVTEDSPLLHGVLAAGTASGARVALSGTSMAAPQLTRLIAASFHHGAAAPAWQTVLDHQDQPVPLAPVFVVQRDRARRRRGDV